MKLIFATHNVGKVREMRALLAGLPVEALSADEAGVRDDVVEDGATFEENAMKKARHAAKRTDQWAVADDSGICIDAFNGAPGVHTARWAGEGASSETLVQHTLRQLANVPEGQRRAHFQSTLVLVDPDGRTWTFTGVVYGRIPLEPRGALREKLPYDRIFIPDGYDRTFAEMPDKEKNSLSHRGLAFQKLREFLESKVH